MELLAGERQKSESSRAVQACNDYSRMGPSRSLRALIQEYGKTPQSTVPTDSLYTLEKWCRKYGWPKRAELYDGQLEAAKNKRAKDILQSGLALVHERVDKLQGLADFLHEQMYEQGESGKYHNIWLPDVKEVGGQVVDIERFNAAIIDQYRGALDDIAKEVGGRKGTLQIGIDPDSPLWRAMEVVAKAVERRVDASP